MMTKVLALTLAKIYLLAEFELIALRQVLVNQVAIIGTLSHGLS